MAFLGIEFYYEQNTLLQLRYLYMPHCSSFEYTFRFRIRVIMNDLEMYVPKTLKGQTCYRSWPILGFLI